MSKLVSLLYVSEATTTDAGAIQSVEDQSQGNNLRDGITGLLLFDGSFWCQYIEGPQASVQNLYERLQGDNRHRNLMVRRSGAVGDERLFPNWRMGFAYLADEQAIQRVLGAEGAAALTTLEAINYSVDVGKYGSR